MQPHARLFAASFIKGVRKDMPFSTLKGSWTRREWNRTVRAQAYSLLRSMERFHNTFGDK